MNYSSLLFASLMLFSIALYFKPSTKEHVRSLAKPSIVYIFKDSNGESGGTGFVLENDKGNRYIVTNRHVCKHTKDDKDNVLVGLEDGTKVRRRIIDIATDTDLCLIEPIVGMAALNIGSGYAVDEHVWVMGHPYLSPDTLVEGDIVGVSDIRILDHIINPGEKEDCDTGDVEQVPFFIFSVPACILTFKAINTTVLTYPGNSGSPLLDDDGYVIGVIFAGDQATNKGSAIRLDELEAFINKY